MNVWRCKYIPYSVIFCVQQIFVLLFRYAKKLLQCCYALSLLKTKFLSKHIYRRDANIFFFSLFFVLFSLSCFTFQATCEFVWPDGWIVIRYAMQIIIFVSFLFYFFSSSFHFSTTIFTRSESLENWQRIFFVFIFTLFYFGLFHHWLFIVEYNVY